LNAHASTNIFCIVVAETTFHEPIGWLNADAPRNVSTKLVTRPTFHADISVLNAALLPNKLSMFVMADTSHVPIAGEHTPIGEAARHVFTAATRSALVA
jgi:hypothetical protein